MYTCPKCQAVSSEAGNCPTCNVQLVASEATEAKPEAAAGSEATTENQPQVGA